MRIAIDARELTGQPTGVGRYLAQLLEAWSDMPAAAPHELVLCAPHPMDIPHAPALRVSVRSAPGRGTWWEQRTLPALLREIRPDVLFAPGYTAPIWCPAPTVVAIHDVSFAARPHWFTWREGLRRRTITKLSAWRATRVLTISNFSKREIVRHLHVAPDKIDVIYPGTTALESTSAAPVRWPSSSPPHARPDGRPLVLYVGSIFNRRHLPELIDGVARLARRRPTVRLELVGDNRTTPRLDIEAHIARAGVAGRLRPYVSNAELADLYARATVFAFLSEYEGFGLTPIEALAAGVPIVVLDTEVAREIYGPAAIYIERPDPGLVEAAIERAMSDEQERGRMRAAARTLLTRYSWRECAHRTLQVLLACGARRG